MFKITIEKSTHTSDVKLSKLKWMPFEDVSTFYDFIDTINIYLKLIGNNTVLNKKIEIQKWTYNSGNYVRSIINEFYPKYKILKNRFDIAVELNELYDSNTKLAIILTKQFIIDNVTNLEIDNLFYEYLNIEEFGVRDYCYLYDDIECEVLGKIIFGQLIKFFNGGNSYTIPNSTSNSTLNSTPYSIDTFESLINPILYAKAKESLFEDIVRDYATSTDKIPNDEVCNYFGVSFKYFTNKMIIFSAQRSSTLD